MIHLSPLQIQRLHLMITHCKKSLGKKRKKKTNQKKYQNRNLKTEEDEKLTEQQSVKIPGQRVKLNGY